MADASQSNIVYMPILKGRAGELRALHEITELTSTRLIPLLEVPLAADETESDDSGETEITGDIGKFATDIKRRWSPDRRLIFDASVVPATPNSIPTVDVINSLARDDYIFTPTVRPSDDEWLIRGIGRALREWSLNSACIRISGDDLDDNDVSLELSIARVLDRLNLEPAEVDVVLDFGPVMDERTMSFAARIARLVLGELPHKDAWRTLVSAAGAFPPDLNSIQSEVLSEIPRHDAAMWNVLKERVRGRVPIFADYAIAYAAQAASVPFAPAPQLRYTAGMKWLVMKGRRQDRRGARQFYDICARVSEVGPVDPELSWGDYYVQQAARSAATNEDLIRTGNAMTWRAVGTSHHLAYVANRLATVGAP